MTATIFLVRHAAHDDVGRYLAGRSPSVHLGPEGLAQAERLGRRMQREQFGTILASPRERARETAAAIAAACGHIPVEASEALDEVDFGHWSGSTFDELNKQDGWRQWNATRSMAETAAGETMLDVQRRAMGLIWQLARRGTGSRLVLVSHGDVIRSVVSYVLGLPIDAWTRFEVSPASITTLVVGDWGGKLLTLNETVA